jgi:amino acid transporter
MSRLGFSEIQKSPKNARDSLELASLASSEPGEGRTSESSSRSGISSSRKLSLENDDPLDSANLANSARRPLHGRSYSISSAFDFTPALFPLSSTQGGYAPLGAPSSISLERQPGGLGSGNLEKHKTLTYLNGLSLIVGLIIGSGIFSSPGLVSSHVGSPGSSLIVWALAGVLVWTGAASYAELGGAIPLNGGAQVYLAKIFGELAGFLFTWCAVMVLKPGGSAIIAIIFGEYLVRAFIGAEVETINPWINKAAAIGSIIAVTLVNSISTKMATRISDMFMFLKFVALLAVTVLGIVVAATGLSYKHHPNEDWKIHGWFSGTSTDITDWAVAIYAGLWAFDGWDNTNYVTGEFKNPSRDLPKVIHTAMPLVLLSYLLANVAYFFVLPKATIDQSNTVAVLFGSEIFGPVGSLILALIVSASCFGALNATTFTSGRLVYVAGKEGYLPAVFGKIGIGNAEIPNLGRLRKRSWLVKMLARVFGDEGSLGLTPINAIVLNGILCIGYIVVGEFEALITFSGVAGYTFYFLTVLGLIVLRINQPNLERPYRTWITTPIIFCCVSLFLVSRAVIARPVQSLIVLGFIVSGVPVYFWRISKRDGPWKESKGSMRFWRRWGRPSNGSG